MAQRENYWISLSRCLTKFPSNQFFINKTYILEINFTKKITSESKILVFPHYKRRGNYLARFMQNRCEILQIFITILNENRPLFHAYLRQSGKNLYIEKLIKRQNNSSFDICDEIVSPWQMRKLCISIGVKICTRRFLCKMHKRGMFSENGNY